MKTGHTDRSHFPLTRQFSPANPGVGGDVYRDHFLGTVGLPLTHELLRRVPIPNIERVPDHFAAQFTFDCNRAVAVAMLPALCRKLE
jgi:hypothetical protein